MNNTEVRASVFLNALAGLGPIRFQALVNRFGTAHQAVEQGIKNWGCVPFFDKDILCHLEQQTDEARRKADEDVKLIEQFKIRIYLAHSGPYPRLLNEVRHPPPIIYAMGEDIAPSRDEGSPVKERPAVAIVGSRRCSYYGEKMTRRLSSELAEAGVTVVSGLARGIDTHAHLSALETGGKTWAVVGSGLSTLYPPENRKLAMAIKESGAIISEFPMSAAPFPANFPRRNRVIAGLSVGTVVVEGTEVSGSLITARLAAEEGRDVFAVPGPATSALSAAPHRLLRLGAKMAESAADIMEEFAQEDRDKLLTRIPQTPGEAAEGIHQNILAVIGEEPIPREILAARINIETQNLPSLLLEMELMGLIKSVPGGMIIKK